MFAEASLTFPGYDIAKKGVVTMSGGLTGVGKDMSQAIRNAFFKCPIQMKAQEDNWSDTAHSMVDAFDRSQDDPAQSDDQNNANQQPKTRKAAHK